MLNLQAAGPWLCRFNCNAVTSIITRAGKDDEIPQTAQIADLSVSVDKSKHLLREQTVKALQPQTMQEQHSFPWSQQKHLRSGKINQDFSNAKVFYVIVTYENFSKIKHRITVTNV